MDPLLMSSLLSAGKSFLTNFKDDSNGYYTYGGINVPIRKNMGERLVSGLSAAGSSALGDIQNYSDTQRLNEMYSPLLKNMDVSLQGKSFRTPDELSSYVKTASDIQNRTDANELKKLYYGILGDRTKINNSPKPDNIISRRELMNTVPGLKEKWGSQYDFGTPEAPKNQAFLDYELPLDIAKMLVPKQRTEINYSGGTNSIKNNIGSGRTKPVKPKPVKPVKPDYGRGQAELPAIIPPQAETRQYQGYTYIKGKDGKWYRQG